jgi:osmotically-inducible protein OsmY
MTATHRLDPDIFVAARKALDDDPGIPQDVRVHADCGTVTLTGTVRSPQEKSAAEAIVGRIDGVVEILNRITVARIVAPEALEPD